MKEVRLVLDYRLASRGLAPLLVDGEPTAPAFWGFSRDLLRRLERLGHLYDRSEAVAKKPGQKPPQPMSERERLEFNALLELVAAEIRAELGAGWSLVMATAAMPAPKPAKAQRNV